MVSTPTCFGTEVPSAGSLLKQRNTGPTQAQEANPGRLTEDGTAVPNHVEVNTMKYILWFVLYFIECICLLIY